MHCIAFGFSSYGLVVLEHFLSFVLSVDNEKESSFSSMIEISYIGSILPESIVVTHWIEIY